MKFTVGMAVFTDPDNGFEAARNRFTIEALKDNPMVAEIIVVDNNPFEYIDAKGGKHPSPIKEFCNKHPKVKYTEFELIKGTAGPRNLIFQLAQNDHVVVIDPHVYLKAGCLEAVEDFYHGSEASPFGVHSPDLLHGPMVDDNGSVHASHMNDQWRDMMWGTWGRAWESPKLSELFTVLKIGNHCRYANVEVKWPNRQVFLGRNEVSHAGLPDDMEWEGHEAKLEAVGCRPIGWGSTELRGPFRIPGHGMGFFACRRDAWLPFHPAARGFGGEEMTTHVRFRRAGRNVWCIPQAAWWHDFGKAHPRQRAENRSYANIIYHRIRNYCLEFKRNQMDLEEIRTHFTQDVPSGLADRPSDWDDAVAGRVWPRGISATGLPINPRDVGMAPKRAAPAAVREARKAICLACPKIRISDADPEDPKSPPDICSVNGKPATDMLKWAACQCPDDPPRWGMVGSTPSDFQIQTAQPVGG